MKSGGCLFLAPNGDDNHPGTLDRPFAGFERAKSEARKMMQRQKTGITVYVRQGTYYLEEPLVFFPEDSGCAQTPIKFAAYPGKKPVLSGGRRIMDQWRPYRDGIWMCEIPGVKEGHLHFTQLFIDGKRQIRARYPNADPAEPGVSGYICPAPVELDWPHTAFKYDPATFTASMM